MRKYRKRKALFLLVLCAIHIVFPQQALGTSAGTPEVVILFDISTSMGWNDPEVLAPDAIKQLVGSLPSHWHIGFVTFHADVVDAIAPGTNTRAVIYTVLDGVEYSNWTSSGIGLLQAMELFSGNATNQTLVFVTDGEKAHMPNSGATEEAALLADMAIAQIIASDIQVHTIVIGEDFDIRHESIMNLAHATNGYLFEGIASEELSGIATTLAFDVLDVSNNLVGTAQITDGTGNFTVRLPTARLDLARVLITAESAIENIAVSGGGANVEIYTGRQFAMVEITRPAESVVDIAFTTSGITNATLIPEWDLQLMAETVETDNMVRFWFADRAGNNILLDPFFSGRTLSIYIDGAQSQTGIESGYLYWQPTATEEAQIHTIQVDLASLGFNMRQGANTITVNVEPLPIEEPEETTLHIFIITIAGLVLAIAVLIFIFHRRKRKISHPPSTPSFESKFEFTGKLNLYVTRTPEDIDIPPQTFDLFRLDSKREISLKDILDKCRILNHFAGVEKIYFVAGKRGSIQVVNDSDCTVLIGSNILIKKRSHVLEYGEKIHVTCEDGISELELHYKSVKPSEKTVVPNPLERYAESSAAQN